MRVFGISLFITAAALVIYFGLDLRGVGAWALDTQRVFQNQMAGAVRALQAGDTGAYIALLAGAGAYGFVHAVGPGHGKFLIGGVGLGTSVRVSHLMALALVSSVMQALWAIVLVYGGLSLFASSLGRMTGLAEDVFAPISYLAVGAVGCILMWRGVRALPDRSEQERGHSHTHTHTHTHSCGHSDAAPCGCAHGPTPEEVAKVGSLRDALFLVGSIAIRPCTGAIFLLIIAWQMDILLAGALAVIVMGIGTAGLTSLVAASSVAARSVTFAYAGGLGTTTQVMPALQIFAGGLIMWMSFILLRVAI
ncbi:MAG: hypothetical protein AAFO72_01570 [Pseudomonadota bacterium]